MDMPTLIDLKSLVELLPVVIVLVIYFVRLEVRITKISRDVCWIKSELRLCRPPSDNPSP